MNPLRPRRRRRLAGASGGSPTTPGIGADRRNVPRPKAKEARIDAEPRFSAKFDGDGVLIEASAEREAANRRARIDKEKRYIAEARPHKARSGGGGGGDLDNDWQI
jgi:hypothetical protein